MKLVFEDLGKHSNFITCEDACKSGMLRFSAAPIINHWKEHFFRKQIENTDTNYIIAAGVNHCPEDWTGYSPYSRVKSLFEYLSPKYLYDLQNDRAMLLLDQSLEGYHKTWLFDFFHEECLRHKINPNNIIYITGNMLVKKDYNKWLKENPHNQKLNVFPYLHFERDMYNLSTSLGLDTSVKSNLQYKRQNTIKLFNCLNKRDRNHRAWFYTKLYQNNLLDDGLINMNTFSRGHYMDGESISPEMIRQVNTTLPSWIDEPNNIYNDSHYIRRFKYDVCLNSFISVISEAHFAESSNTLFISEKTFKIIASRHPFIILGNKGTLQKLRDLGYKTFDGFIDESYDTLPTFERMDAIIVALKKLKKEKNLLKWYKRLQPVLNYNYARLKNRSIRKNKTVADIELLYNKKFGADNV